ncbi:2-amino-4-hydroxy-6-hydroxymethyldihydropteridine diphosphokinase [Acinetobacter radioresistens]|jgi:2-amino-4-hydroxy-6-hydroxymethyldihydropteridine diphosphokinase|uniref:2-amino-4-hydroxy-6-hydroxymethyldihydropteridine pyrophosphokinase n=1 Tax=Acinetobacter radioresistens SK82 TaxID=596318 RepID=A0ABP2GI77_ACIRA|nr:MULTISPECIES: 2-amino-4-hydroxy-6-hydroxymethyldihydropteridine diphosphokinase [Acinetobacter]EET81274.1 2-amino-4-hydroxy-6-hydroxymethyldihydropteridine diphosphokinase [Acinetobacter radioresistens SK82]EEY86353.1 2-amino-4-hydroxy-6-hydroxymethyldihydropteridine diphosphokinase [Acinetobacter radioresistens SH164]ENV87102.1 2-amino-4-hydroxy-6-hydroxymethyldihydropteridine diphosphokinase [Acinetobacter radioresistens NIPH 2130]EXB88106.1 2-amino-4-hydroxy-6-hydroxymethyldihydropteridin
MSTIAYIGLGSNLGDSRQILTQAVSRLSTLGPVKVSRLYQSPPMGPQDQPHYYNAVAQLETVLEPLPLLDQLQAFEQEAGRVRLRRWGERTLDLDLLLYGQQSIQHERLNVPHIGLLERDFVVIPLLDLDVSLSVNGQLLQQLDLVQQSELTVLADEQWASI